MCLRSELSKLNILQLIGWAADCIQIEQINSDNIYSMRCLGDIRLPRFHVLLCYYSIY